MSKLVGAMAAITALIAGVVNQIDALTNLERAFVAYLLGWAGASIWQALMSSGGKVLMESANVHSSDEGSAEADTEAA